MLVADLRRRITHNPGVQFLRRCFAIIRRGASRAAQTVSARNFITLHYAYFVLTCLICSGIFYGVSRPDEHVRYVDCLFLVISAMTLAGLNTVNLSTVNTAQHIILFLLIIFGSAIFVSSFVVHVRKRAFEQRFAHIAELRRHRLENLGGSFRRRLSSISRSDTRDSAHPPNDGPATGFMAPTLSHMKRTRRNSQNNPDNQEQAIDSLDAIEKDRVVDNPDVNNDDHGVHIKFGPTVERPRGHYSQTGTHGRPISNGGKAPVTPDTNGTNSEKPSGPLSNHPPMFDPATASRNSQFHHLSEKERKQLGGYEYKAICLLSWLVPAYFILFQLLGCLGLGAYVAYNRPATAFENGLNPWWVGAFNAVSAFNNSGMSLLDANMVAFQTSIYMLLTMSLLILAGNTCYPIFLRLIVWTFLRIIPRGEQWEDNRRTLQFLLDHPRRCYTNLFPSRHTWWLLSAVVILNCIDWAAFELLNIGNKTIQSLPPGIRTLDGLFQAIAVRSGGFYVVPISSVRISLQVLYVIMMYISVYPVVITMRNTNVYEERSLGIYADDPDYVADRTESKKGFFARLLKSSRVDDTTQYFVRHQLRAQLSHDIWVIVVAVFVISCFEATKFEHHPLVYSVFNIIFETVSAYGCVGISVGLPDQAYSFSGAWTTCSKLVLCAVMIRGRHRGLPVAIDKAVLLPREEVDEAEEDDGAIRRENTISRGKVV